MAVEGAMDLAAAGNKVLLGLGGGTAPGDPFVQAVVLVPAPDTPLGYQQLGSLDSAAHTLTVPAGSTWAVCVPEGADVRWRDDGAAPTASVGMPLPAGATLVYRATLGNLQFIGQSAGAKVNVSFYA